MFSKEDGAFLRMNMGKTIGVIVLCIQQYLTILLYMDKQFPYLISLKEIDISKRRKKIVERSNTQ